MYCKLTVTVTIICRLYCHSTPEFLDFHVYCQSLQTSCYLLLCYRQIKALRKKKQAENVERKQHAKEEQKEKTIAGMKRVGQFTKAEEGSDDEVNGKIVTATFLCGH